MEIQSSKHLNKNNGVDKCFNFIAINCFTSKNPKKKHKYIRISYFKTR